MLVLYYTDDMNKKFPEVSGVIFYKPDTIGSLMKALLTDNIIINTLVVDIKVLKKINLNLILLGLFRSYQTKVVVKYKNVSDTFVSKDEFYSSVLYKCFKEVKARWVEHFQEIEEINRSYDILIAMGLSEIPRDLEEVLNQGWRYDININYTNFADKLNAYQVIKYYIDLDKQVKEIEKMSSDNLINIKDIDKFSLMKELSTPDRTEDDITRITYYGNTGLLEDLIEQSKNSVSHHKLRLMMTE